MEAPLDGLIQADSWKARARCIINWGPTAICVPTEGFSREVQATLASIAAVSLMAGPEHGWTIPLPNLSHAEIPRCGEA